VSKMGVPEKLSVNKYKLDEEGPHIKVDSEACQRICSDKPCLRLCPACVYTEQDGRIVADSAGCLECGTCQVICPGEALRWSYPRGGFGVVYRYG